MPGVRCQVSGARCQVPGVRYQVPGAGAGAGRYERLSATRVLPTAYCPKATVCASPQKAVGSWQDAVGSWQDAADSRQLIAHSCPCSTRVSIHTK